MKNDFYSKEALLLYKEAKIICNNTHSDRSKCWSYCKYASSIYCKPLCLQEKYNIVDLKTLKSLDIIVYSKEKDICLMSRKLCIQHPELKCDICFLESLLKDPYIKFLKKE